MQVQIFQPRQHHVAIPHLSVKLIVVELENKCQIYCLLWYQVGHTQTIIQRDFDKLLGKVRLTWVLTIIGLFEQAPLVIFENVIYSQCDRSVFCG
jgi:hypothetical protein